jgi:hypothetical protein
MKDSGGASKRCLDGLRVAHIACDAFKLRAGQWILFWRREV